MSTLQINLCDTGRDLLGESPAWDAQAQALYWVDTRRRLVRRWQPGQPAASVRQWVTPADVGSIALVAGVPARDASPSQAHDTGAGQLLLALEDQLALLDLASGGIHTVAPITHPRPAMRLNDGRTDREGRFVVGSMVLHRRDAEGSLYRLAADGRVTTLLGGGIAVANATCFSPDGRTLYFADSLAGVVRAWDYGIDGRLSHERVLVDTRPDGSGPDGATVDADGCLWVALVLAAKMACYAPDGRLLRTVPLPVPYPTCPCFGGPDLSTLYITSIRDSGNVLRSDDPAAGGLVAVQGLGVRGMAEVPFRYAPGGANP